MEPSSLLVNSIAIKLGSPLDGGSPGLAFHGYIWMGWGGGAALINCSREQELEKRKVGCSIQL
jgi:hypothetical protein